MKIEITWDQLKDSIRRCGTEYGGRPRFIERFEDDSVIYKGSMDNLANDLTAIIFKVARNMINQRPWTFDIKYILQAYHCKLITKEECRQLLGLDEIKEDEGKVP